MDFITRCLLFSSSRNIIHNEVITLFYFIFSNRHKYPLYCPLTVTEQCDINSYSSPANSLFISTTSGRLFLNVFLFIFFLRLNSPVVRGFGKTTDRRLHESRFLREHPCSVGAKNRFFGRVNNLKEHRITT